METVNIIEELIENIQGFNDNRFNLESSIEEAIAVLEQEMSINKLSECHFKENKWYLEANFLAKRVGIDFDKVRESIQFNKKIDAIEFIDIVKCWTASLIEEGYNSNVVVKMVNEGLKDFLVVTKGLTETNEDELADTLLNLSESKKRIVCNSALNFLDYFPELGGDYVSLLYSVKPEYQGSKARLLPPSKDVLIFSKVLEKHFSKDLSEFEYLKWFPIWLWWNLTMLIPMRPSDYCTIERDCLFQKDGKFYIKLPRHKQKFNNRRNIQILDKISIPEKLYRKIEEYKDKTNSYGRTDTLVSYLSIPHFVDKRYFPTTTSFHDNKLNPYKYSINILRDNLKSFYEYIVFGEYSVGLSEGESDIEGLSITQKLRPGDTRHLAFLNLNRQGYHPVEIARIGGHNSIYSQNHYFNHVSNFVDLEILELIANIDLDSYKNKMENSGAKSDYTISVSFIEKYVLRPPMADVKIKLRDGYCTDANQNCKVEDCWECDAWRISEEELLEKHDILAQKLKDSESCINEVIENLKNIYKGIYNHIGKDEFYSSNNPEIRKELINKSKRLDNAIRKYINLMKVKERIDSVGNKR